ncbi:MAG TPA: hypothetical protein P5519_01640 [Spirochaetia bacterium]|nr:hypothetical protein [Spirochaetales bacterium]HQK34981.1 hypothetical protein [Spirochaetales bacterium]HRS64575.1 hypothetical protein [Spirochaetia bacterium]
MMKRKRLIRLSCFLVFSVLFTSLFAQSKPIWLVFEEGKQFFYKKQFGEALRSFEEAINQRKEIIAWALERLRYAQKSPLKKKTGDSISKLLTEFAKLDFTDVDYTAYQKQSNGDMRVLIAILKRQRLSDYHRALLDALSVAYDFRPIEYYADSFARMERELDVLQYYPEAEFWKGRVFMVEGELSIAEKQFLRAFDMRGSLEIPADQYSILYTLSEVYKLQNNMLAWYNTMQRILFDDPVAGTPPMDPYLKEAMLATLRNQGFDKFMILYRLKSGFSLTANIEIGEYILRKGAPNAELHLAIAANMIITEVITMYQKENPDYKYTTIADFFEQVSKNREISEYLTTSRIYSVLLNLGDALYVLGQPTFAIPIWSALVNYAPSPWSGTARERLKNPLTAMPLRQ